MRYFTLSLVLAGSVILSSCAQVSPNDGLVPRMSAQANLPYTPTVLPNGMLGAASGGATVSPLTETRKAYWSTP
jgi:hypothetical protein